jgi:hypothetical protein
VDVGVAELSGLDGLRDVVGEVELAGGLGGRCHGVVWLVSVDSRTIPLTGSTGEKKRELYLCHTAGKT